MLVDMMIMYEYEEVQKKKKKNARSVFVGAKSLAYALCLATSFLGRPSMCIIELCHLQTA